MTFWAYMLHCRGGAYYVGHTDNLEYRIGQHQSGLVPGYTADRLPVSLVWSQDFATRADALEAERRIKGWGRAKKMALIRGDWDRISTLAKGKYGPSTSSGRTEKEDEMPDNPNPVRPELVEGLSLVCHPDTPCRAVTSITVSTARNEYRQLILRFHIEGNIQRLSIPAPSRYSSRNDGLWCTTCVEAFARPVNGSEYIEFNFAPSTAWAAFEFASYRKAVDPPQIEAPPIDVELSADGMTISVAVDVSSIALLPGDDAWRLALSAVIEEVDGAKSYWALTHPPGKPDFHHPDCFALTLEAPDPA